MKSRQLSVIAFAILFSGCAAEDESARRVSDSPPPTPSVEAPAGFKWVPNIAFCDEFNGTELDRDKWHDQYPGWEGRPPGKFVPSSVSVEDGFLQIKSTSMLEPQGDQGQWTIACGAIQSKAQNAKFGYYECRMKASNVSTSSTFWLKNPRSDKRPFLSTELDIQECIGNAQRWPAFADCMISNTHVQLIPEDDPTATETDEEKKASLEKLQGSQKHTHEMNVRVSDDFHVYGCWWVDPNTMKFFLDGEYAFTINPPAHIVDDPFDQEMFVNLVCEIYNWEVPPTPEELADSSRNTTYYDYVRAYKLVPVE